MAGKKECAANGETSLQRRSGAISFVVVIAAAVLALAVFYVAQKGFLGGRNDTETAGEKTVPANGGSKADDLLLAGAGNKITFRPQSFSMTIGPAWRQVPLGEIVLPQGVTGAQFGYLKEGTSCTFAYVSGMDLQQYAQSSFGARVFTADNEQLDSSWWVGKSRLPDGFKFQSARQPLDGEVRPHWFTTYGNLAADYGSVFVLFSSTGGPVADDCDADFTTMLSSIKREYETMALTPQSAGTLYVGARRNPKPTRQLMFVPDDSIMRYEVMQLTEEQLTVPAPALYDNKLLFAADDRMQLLDVFTGKSTGIPGINLGEGEIINDFYMSGGRLFYLGGKSCVTYMAKCNLKLFEYDMGTRRSMMLADNLPFRVIAGYDKDSNVLYLSYGDGDAGCFWGMFGGYNFSFGRKEDYGTYSGCEEGTTYKGEAEKYDAVIQELTSEQSAGYSIRVENGLLTAPQASSTIFGISAFRIFK